MLPEYFYLVYQSHIKLSKILYSSQGQLVYAFLTIGHDKRCNSESNDANVLPKVTTLKQPAHAFLLRVTVMSIHVGPKMFGHHAQTNQ